MTSPKRSLHPAGGDDGGTLLSALEFVARGSLKLAEVVGAVIRQGMSFQPSPQVLDRVEVGCVRWQKRNQDAPAQGVQVIAYQAASVRLQTIPDYEQRLLQMRLERFEEFDDLFFLDAALVQPEQAVAARQSGNHRDVVPVEVKLDDRRLPDRSPSAHPCGPLADTGFVDKYDHSALSPGFFLSLGQVLRFQLRTASSLRSSARFSGFCALNPIAPRMRQT